MSTQLNGYLNMELLRFTTAGSVDDGKSTLIGRLLYDSKSIFEDQLQAVKEASERLGGDEVNLALLTDGLRAEREQGITIDVAYRYFATPNRKFIIADTPGHIEYTRNMVTGASTADVAIILIDARNGIVEQTRRHAYIASLLQLPHVILAINKMDLVDFSEEVYTTIRTEFESIAAQLRLGTTYFLPISARDGDNVVDASTRTPWYTGPTLLQLLETIPVHNSLDDLPARFPVQYIIRPHRSEFHDYRGYAGRVAGGCFKVGDAVTILPSRTRSVITAIDAGTVSLQEAATPQSVTLRLAHNVDISRGDMIVRTDDTPPTLSAQVTLMVCWLNHQPLRTGGRYIVRHTSDETVAIIQKVHYKIDIQTLGQLSGEVRVDMNDIACIRIKTLRPLKFDSYSTNRISGSLVLIDENTFETVGAGMIVTDLEDENFSI
ncbi:MAG: sulfate adenylyltransferase [Paludibacter sp. 47-17]|jgi:sulfate adenylyltransferase subunit 1|nr:MAG: sulfate adenylyltransferase [Paludibacter sp. SCN 50-10]ODU61955.1 MAG: sulfate adenylyltransferase [Paludibacter sp. SCN 51-9]OJX92431.1 MAG: sulfate adenylyltransferase [Paludibacter sp. 47-17]